MAQSDIKVTEAAATEQVQNTEEEKQVDKPTTETKDDAAKENAEESK